MIVGSGLPRPEPEEQDAALIGRALEVAATTPGQDIPVGAVVLDPAGRELAVATNRREVDADPTQQSSITKCIVFYTSAVTVFIISNSSVHNHESGASHLTKN